MPTVKFTILADNQEFRRAVAELPGVTEKEAKAAAKKLLTQQIRTSEAQKREFEKTEQAKTRAAIKENALRSQLAIKEQVKLEGLKARIQLKEQARASREAAKIQQRQAEQVGQFWADTFSTALGTAAGDVLSEGLGRAAQAALDTAFGAQEAREEIIRLSRETRVSADILAAFEVAARKTNQPLESIAGTLVDLNERILDISRAEGEVEVFNELGISAVDAAGKLREPTVVITELFDRLVALEDQTKAAGLATAVLGDQGAQLLAAFQSTGGLSRFVELTEKYGVDVGPEAVALTDAWTEETNRLGIITRKVGDEFITALGTEGGAVGLLQSAGKAAVVTTILVGQLSDKLIDVGSQIAGVAAEAAKIGAVSLLPTSLQPVARSLIEVGEATLQSEEATKRLASTIGVDLQAALSTYDELVELTKGIGDVQRTGGLGFGPEGLGAGGAALQRLQGQVSDFRQEQAEAARAAEEADAARLARLQEQEQALADLRRRNIQDLAGEQRRADMAQMMALNAQIERRRDVASQTLGLATNVSSTLIGLAQQQDRALSAQDRAELRRYKGQATARALIQGALAAGQVIATTPVLAWPAGLVFAGATAAANVAAIQATQVAHMGLNRSRTVANDEAVTVVRNGETVLTRTQTDRMGGPEGVRQAANGGGSPSMGPVMIMLDGEVIGEAMAIAAPRGRGDRTPQGHRRGRR